MKIENIGTILLTLAVLIILIVIITLLMSNMTTTFSDETTVNETRSMLNGTGNCKWYQLGCQKLACVVDCQEINKNAGEIICVC